VSRTCVEAIFSYPLRELWKTEICWPGGQCGLFVAPEEETLRYYSFEDEHPHMMCAAETSGILRTVDYSPWLGSLCFGTADGNVMSMLLPIKPLDLPKPNSVTQADRFQILQCNQSNTPIDHRPARPAAANPVPPPPRLPRDSGAATATASVPTPPVSSAHPKAVLVDNDFRVQTHDFSPIVHASKMRKSTKQLQKQKQEPLPATDQQLITKVRWSPNEWSRYYLASSTRAGFVFIQCIEQGLSKVREKVQPKTGSQPT